MKLLHIDSSISGAQSVCRQFDYARFAEPLRERIRVRSQEVCAAAGIEIEHVNKSHICKEDLVARVLQARGDASGLAHVISAMEACPSYKPWHDKSSGKTYLRTETGKCLHYYFYFMDDELGLCYLRVLTWAPFGLQLRAFWASLLGMSRRVTLTPQEHQVRNFTLRQPPLRALRSMACLAILRR